MVFFAEWLFILFVFTIPWENLYQIDGLGTFSRVIGLWAALFGVFYIISIRRVTINRPIYWAFCFLIWCSLSFFWSIDQERSISRIATYVQLFVLAFIFINLVHLNNSFFEKALDAYLLGSWIAGAETIRQFMVGNEIAYMRFAADGFDPNDLSIYLALAVPLAIRRGQITLGYLKKALAYSYLPFSVFCIGLTASRTGFLAIILVFTLYAYFLIKKTSILNSLIWLLLFVTLLGYSVSFVPDDVLARFFTLGDEVSGGTLNNRTIIWGLGVDNFFNNPLTGVGAGAFGVSVSSSYGEIASPHNVFLSFSVELGIVGLFLWVGFIYSSVKNNFQNIKSNLPFVMAIFFTLVIAFLSLNFEWRKVTWLFIAIICCFPGSRFVGLSNK